MLARLRPYVLLFVGLTVIYQANLRPVDSGDTLPGSLIPFAVNLNHTITLDRYAPWLLGHVWFARGVLQTSHGHYFSWYPIGAPLLVSPLYVPVAWAVRNWDPASIVIAARIAGKVAASLIAALSAVLLLILLKRITSNPWAWCLTAVYALGTETWSISSQALWQHGPAELAIIGALLCLDFWNEDRSSLVLWIGGACTAVAFICRPTSLTLLAAIVAALFLARATLGAYVRLIALPLLGGLLLAGYNHYVFHRVSGGYAVGSLDSSVARGLCGMFLSPGRGLLVYTPVALFALCAFSARASEARHKHSALFAAAAVFIVLDSIGIAQWVDWWGGFCWGPRLLTELAPPLVVLMAIGVSAIGRPWLRSAFAILAIYSVLTQAAGAFFYPNGHWDAGPPDVDHDHARLWNWRDNPIARTVGGGLYWQPYAIVGAALTGGIAAARVRVRELNVNAYEGAEPAKVPGANPGLP